MQFAKGESLEYKGYTFEHHKHYREYSILVTKANTYRAEFHRCWVVFNHNEVYYDMPDITDKIPGLVYENRLWIFPEIIDLSNVADEMIRLIELYNELQTLIEENMASSFASKVKSARK